MNKHHFLQLISLFWLLAGLALLLGLISSPQLWKKRAATAPVSFAPLLASPTPTPPSALASGRNWAPHQLIVKFKSGASALSLQALSADSAVLSTQKIEGVGGQAVLLNLAESVDPLEEAGRLGRDDAVEFAEPNYKFTPLLVPNDTRFPQQWDLGKIEAPLAWDFSTGTAPVTIAVLDTGIERTHPDLVGRVVGDTTLVGDHGTKVAGVVGALTNNNVGLAAVGFSKITLDSHVICVDPSTCYAADIASGIDRAVAKNEKIILMAFGGPDDSSLVRDAVSSAAFLGTLLIGAAGNSGTTAYTYPAAYTQVMSVAATDAFDARLSSSQFGSWVDVAAPGSSVLTTNTGNTYVQASGTSMAAGLTASLAGLLLSVKPGLSGSQLRAILQVSTDPVNFALRFGRINARKALAQLAAPTPTSTPTPTLSVPSPSAALPASPLPTVSPYTPPPAPTFVTAPECQGINPLTDPYCALLEIPKLFYIVVLFLQYAAALLVIVFLIGGGFLWLTAGDDPAQLSRARLTLFWALAGLVVTFSLRAVSKILAGLGG